jgi:Family of unknown function (DUF6221)
MDELIAFLRARYDEAEVTAKAAFGNSGHWWQRNTEYGPDGHLFEGDDPEGGYLSGTIVVYDEGSPTPDEFAHIALHDPAAVLADIAGKRKIVDMAEAQHGYHLPEGVHDGRDDDERKCDEAMQVMMAEVLHHLAEEFAAHPDYKAKDWGEFTQPASG